MLFSGKEFSEILRAVKHVKELKFYNWKVITDDEHELGQMEGWKIEILWFGYYHHVHKYFGDYEKSCIMVFLSIIGCPNLLKSLREIKFTWGEEIEKKLLSKAKEIFGIDYNMLIPCLKFL